MRSKEILAGQQWHQPFKPVMIGGSAGSAAASPIASPLAAAGKKIFESHSCNACHGQGGAGTAIAPKLVGIGKQFTTDQLENLFKHPTAKMDAGGMPHFQLSPQNMKALISYLDSLK